MPACLPPIIACLVRKDLGSGSCLSYSQVPYGPYLAVAATSHAVLLRLTQLSGRSHCPKHQLAPMNHDMATCGINGPSPTTRITNPTHIMMCSSVQASPTQDHRPTAAMVTL